MRDRIEHLTSRILHALGTGTQSRGSSAPDCQGPSTANWNGTGPLPEDATGTHLIPPVTNLVDDRKPDAMNLVSPAITVPDLSTEGVKVAAMEARFTADTPSDAYHSSSGDRPSPYLQSLCPLCFGAAFDVVKEFLGGLPDTTL